MKYEYSSEWTLKTRNLIEALGFQHIQIKRIACIKSSGTKTRRTIARIHSLQKVMQLGMQLKPFYSIELISEQFDLQNEDEKIKTLIHELMHIPQGFGGGFRHHKNHVTHAQVEQVFQKYKNLIKKD